MNRVGAGLAAAAVSLLPMAVDAACDPARFGDSVKNTCARATAGCFPGYLPDEVRQIGRGAALEWVGLSVNDGRATWRALDVERSEVVIVERYAGRRAAQAPAAAASSPDEYSITTGSGDARAVDHVRRFPVAASTRDKLACLALDAMSHAAPTPRMLTDMSSRFYLLIGGQARDESVLGRFEGAAAAFERGVDEVIRRQRPGVTPR